jgi:SAM-dependent methyltransferase
MFEGVIKIMNFADFYSDVWENKRYPPVVADLCSFKTECMKKNLDLRGKKILDVGCGDGKTGSSFVEHNDVYGIDLSAKAVEEAQKKGVKAQVGDAASGLPFQDEEFDVVLITDVIEHVFDPLGLLHEAKRVLKQGGILYCVFPNGANILNRLCFLFTGDLVDHSGRTNILHGSFPFTGHIRIISPRLMKKMLAYLSLKIAWMDYWFPAVFETRPLNQINWLAKMIVCLRFHKIFPNLISVLCFCKCQK